MQRGMGLRWVEFHVKYLCTEPRRKMGCYEGKKLSSSLLRFIRALRYSKLLMNDKNHSTKNPTLSETPNANRLLNGHFFKISLKLVQEEEENAKEGQQARNLKTF